MLGERPRLRARAAAQVARETDRALGALLDAAESVVAEMSPHPPDHQCCLCTLRAAIAQLQAAA